MKIMEILEATPELRIPVNSRSFRERGSKEMIDLIIDSFAGRRLEEIMAIGVNKPVTCLRKYG